MKKLLVIGILVIVLSGSLFASDFGLPSVTEFNEMSREEQVAMIEGFRIGVYAVAQMFYEMVPTFLQECGATIDAHSIPAQTVDAIALVLKRNPSLVDAPLYHLFLFVWNYINQPLSKATADPANEKAVQKTQPKYMQGILGGE
jgi:hypothetical protein